MLHLPIEYWILTTLNAPQWCFTCWWIMTGICTINFCVQLIKLGKELR